ncbi:MAG: S-layer homology domain-containing protein, partial [Butyricicoccus sp.]
MKNLKKVLALVLAFACAFTMFAGALTFSDVKPGDDYSAAITMLSDLEVISGDGKGNFNPTGTITRAEACVLIANMMNGG